MTLSNHVKKQKETLGSLIDLIHNKMGHHRRGRDHKPYIHASDLTNPMKEFCPREFALLDISSKPKKNEYIETALALTFSMGEHLQSELNNNWLVDYMQGHWKCSSCSTEVKYTSKPKQHCGKSGITCNWVYEEVRFFVDLFGISLAIDGIVSVGGKGFSVIEAKSIIKDDFKKLKAPHAEHRLRTAMYISLIKWVAKYSNDKDQRNFAKKINTATATVLYMAKSFGTKDATLKETTKQGNYDRFSPFKEYTIRAKDTDFSRELGKAAAYAEYTKSHKIPCGVCRNTLDKRAKQCSVMAECFSGKYMHQVTWLEDNKQKHNRQGLTIPCITLD